MNFFQCSQELFRFLQNLEKSAIHAFLFLIMHWIQFKLYCWNFENSNKEPKYATSSAHTFHTKFKALIKRKFTQNSKMTILIQQSIQLYRIIYYKYFSIKFFKLSWFFTRLQNRLVIINGHLIPWKRWRHNLHRDVGFATTLATSLSPQRRGNNKNEI